MLRNKRGMTLVEILFSLTLLAIVAAALIKSSLVAMNATITNELRDEAVRVTEQRMSELRNTPFTGADMLDTHGSVTEIPAIRKNVRTGFCDYTINRNISNIDDNNRQVTLRVTWSYRNQRYEHGISTILRSQ